MTLRALSAGPHALRALRDGASGTVHSLFDRSLYARLGGQLICIGPRGLGDGPLNLLCEPWLARAEPAKRLRVGDAAVFTGGQLRIGASLTVQCAPLAAWRPSAIPSGTTQAAGLEALEPHLQRLPADGLARLMLAPRRSGETPILRLARPVAGALADFVGGGDTDVLSDLVSLLGLGPGLTPSGDDFLGGAMIAIAATGETRTRDAIWGNIGPHVASRTTDISAAHLTAAADGLGHAALHDALNAIAIADAKKLDAAFGALAAIGHTSGLDALAGAVLVLRARR